MADEIKNPDFDLDEDLFGFEETSLIDAFDGEDDADLDEIFAAFEEAQQDLPTEEDDELDAVAELPAEEDDLGGFFESEKHAAEPLPEVEPAAADVWTPGRAITAEGGAPPAPKRTHAGLEVRQAAARSVLSRSVIWVLVAVTSINALVAIVTLSSMSTMRNSVAQVGRHVTATADEIRSGAYEQARVLNELQTPIVSLDAEEHPTFDRVRADITGGQYSEARRRLYALLSIIDRLDPDQRAKVEARAQYLLAEALHLEALERMEAEQ